MSVKYQDYYAVLGVPRTATQAEIQRAYRQLARKHHPDVDKSTGSTQRFQQIGEAYEVLKHPDTRARYDQLGHAWKDGQDFTPPPGWEPRGAQRASGADFEGFSDFFASLFGGRGGRSPFAGFDFEGVDGRRGAARVRRDTSVEAELHVPFTIAVAGGKLGFEMRGEDGARKSIDVRVPEGSATGGALRLRGQGGTGHGGVARDLVLRLVVDPPAGFSVDGDDLRTTLRVSPWEAALGARVPLRAPDGAEAVVTLPAGTSSGRTLRLRGQGLPRRAGGRGDLLAEVAIALPAQPSDVERRLWEELARASGFDPRRT